MTTTSTPRVLPLTRLRPGWGIRTVDRWGLLAGVTGMLASVLLVIVFATPGNGPYAWTGPATDVLGDLSTLATVPVAVAVLAVCGYPRALRAITALAVVAMVTMVAVSVLFVSGRASFTTATDVAYVGLTGTFAWVFVASRAGRATGRLPRQVAKVGIALGAAGSCGAGLLTASTFVPTGWLGHDVMYGIDLLTAVPFALFPIWLIALSCRLRADNAPEPAIPASVVDEGRYTTG